MSNYKREIVPSHSDGSSSRLYLVVSKKRNKRKPLQDSVLTYCDAVLDQIIKPWGATGLQLVMLLVVLMYMKSTI